MSRFLVGFLVFTILARHPVFSQEITAPDTVAKTVKLNHIVGFPVVLYSPELTWALGGAGNYYFKFSHKDSLVRTSFLQSVGIVTLRKQLVLGIDGSIFFPNERYILRLHGSLSRFPDRFWGLGNNSRKEDRESYAISQYYIFPQLLRNVYKKFYVGVAYESQNVFSFEYYQKPNGDPSIFESQNVAGRKGGLTSGTGFILLWDTRNNTFSSTRGLYFQYYVNKFSHAFGSSFDYINQILDIRKYVSTNPNSVLAFQFLGNFNSGDVPVRSMANIGSGTIMRGYYDGRFTDKSLMAVQAELRQHVYKRFGFVTFVGVGRVARTIGDFFRGNSSGVLPTLKPSVGAGLRYALDSSERLNLRFDVGVGKHSNGFYLSISEAF